jgi:hypothetical protein
VTDHVSVDDGYAAARDAGAARAAATPDTDESTTRIAARRAM